MPRIQVEERFQVEGGQAPLLVKRSSLQVSSCEQFSLSVDGVPPLQAPKNRAGKKKTTKKKPEKLLMTRICKPTLSNVKFVAIYDGGQANGLKVKVGSAKFELLTPTKPLVFMGRAAAGFGSKPTIILENGSALPRTAVMLVGSDLPKGAWKSKLVKVSSPAAKGSGRKGKKKPS